MVLFLFAGAAGMWFHFRGGAEFQLEIDPAQSRWNVFTKVMRAKAPPVLASGVMMQLGLLGLVYAYRHPALQTELLIRRGVNDRKRFVRSLLSEGWSW